MLLQTSKTLAFTQNKILQAAVVGLGVGEQHCLAYMQNLKSRLKMVYDLDVDRSKKTIEKLQCGIMAQSFEEILQDKEIDIVSIASFDDAHYSQVKACLEANKKVFVEKPLCRSLTELKSLATIWSQTGQPMLASNLVLRAAPLYVWLKQAIRRGDLGDIYAIDGDYLYGRIHKVTEGWRSTIKDYSVMAGGGIHLIDLMLWLLSEKPTEVMALGNQIATKNTQFQYDDFITAIFTFKSGIIGKITANFGCVHHHQHVLRIFGTKGTFLFDEMGARIHWKREEKSSPDFLTQESLPESKGVLIPIFIDRIMNEEDTYPYVAHEFALISAVVAADRAHQSKQKVEIEYVC